MTAPGKPPTGGMRHPCREGRALRSHTNRG